MSLKLSTSFVQTNIPGAYINTKVASTPVGLGTSGNIVIIGEADGGLGFSNENLKENSFTPDQGSKISEKYLGGIS